MKAEYRSRHPNTAEGKELAPVEQPVYLFRVKSHLGDQSADCFEGLTFGQEKDGITVLTGPMADPGLGRAHLAGFTGAGMRRSGFSPVPHRR